MILGLSDWQRDDFVPGPYADEPRDHRTLLKKALSNVALLHVMSSVEKLNLAMSPRTSHSSLSVHSEAAIRNHVRDNL
jgi:hypothetical protein